nr:MAG TPA: hypothetical protein [Caudoviricetes sp.]
MLIQILLESLKSINGTRMKHNDHDLHISTQKMWMNGLKKSQKNRRVFGI